MMQNVQSRVTSLIAKIRAFPKKVSLFLGRRNVALVIWVTLFAFLAGSIGGRVAVSQEGYTKELLTVVSAVGTLGAAIATFWTVHEMKIGRVQQARARLAAVSRPYLATITWTVIPELSVPAASLVNIELRNASQGVAWNAHAEWAATNKIQPLDLERIERLLGVSSSVAVDSSTYGVVFENELGRAVLPLSGKVLDYVGDVGPAQCVDLFIPPPVMNYSTVKLLSAISVLHEGDALSLSDMPFFEVTFHHDSPYRTNIRDSQKARFHLEDFQLEDGHGQMHQDFARSWQKLTVSLRLEFTSQRIEALPMVAV